MHIQKFGNANRSHIRIPVALIKHSNFKRNNYSPEYMFACDSRRHLAYVVILHRRTMETAANVSYLYFLCVEMGAQTYQWTAVNRCSRI